MKEKTDFLLSAPTPEVVVALRPSPAAQERLRHLLDGNCNAALNDIERADSPSQDPRPREAGSRRIICIVEVLRRLVAG